MNISQFLPLVERVAKVEYHRIPSHMVDLDELINIGAMALQSMFKNKTPANNMDTSSNGWPYRIAGLVYRHKIEHVNRR